MAISRNLLAAVLLASVLPAAAPPTLAEVSAETDAFGTYVRTVVLSSGGLHNVKVWTVARPRPLAYPLNPTGDQNGDLWPFIAENPWGSRWPWVLWSRFDGAGYRLAWSRWTGTGWTAIDWLDRDGTSLGDDLGPSVAFGSDGRPYAAWWRSEEEGGTVYLSLFLVNRWMVPFQVSDSGVDSWNPSIGILPDGKIQVEYDTPAGRVTRVVVFNRPSTITDDVNPVGQMSIESSSTRRGDEMSH